MDGIVVSDVSCSASTAVEKRLVGISFPMEPALSTPWNHPFQEVEVKVSCSTHYYLQQIKHFRHFYLMIIRPPPGVRKSSQKMTSDSEYIFWLDFRTKGGGL